MGEEAERIAKLIELNQVDNFITKVDCDSLDTCASELARLCPTKVIMLLSTTKLEAKESGMFIRVLIPERAGELLNKWLEQTIASVSAGSLSVTLSEAGTRVVIMYPLQSEQSPIKLAEVAIGNAFAYLKKVGLYTEPPEEKEWDFDDIM